MQNNLLQRDFQNQHVDDIACFDKFRQSKIFLYNLPKSNQKFSSYIV